MLTNKDIKKYIIEANKEFKQNGYSNTFKQICKLILENANINQMLEFVKNVDGVDITPFSKRVLANGDVQQNLNMMYVNGCDTKRHRDFIIESQDIECNINAGRLVDEYFEEYANKHGAIVAMGTAYQNYKYLERNKSKALDKQRHLDVIINSKNMNFIVKCAKNIEGIEVLKLARLVIDSKDVRGNIAFASIKGMDIKAHLDVVWQLGDARDNFDVLKEFGDKCDIQKHVLAIFKSKDNDFKYCCLMWLRKVGIVEQFASCKELQKFIKDLDAGKVKIDYEFIDFLDECDDNFVR